MSFMTCPHAARSASNRQGQRHSSELSGMAWHTAPTQRPHSAHISGSRSLSSCPPPSLPPSARPSLREQSLCYSHAPANRSPSLPCQQCGLLHV
eukprot:3292247-Rhodomonas_salina.3